MDMRRAFFPVAGDFQRSFRGAVITRARLKINVNHHFAFIAAILQSLIGFFNL